MIAAVVSTIISIAVTFGLIIQAQAAPDARSLAPSDCGKKYFVPTYSVGDGGLAVSGTNIYTAWNCHSNVLFTKSNDGGKTYANTTLISEPNSNPKTVVDNVTISASGNNVAIMWDSNKTGIVNPEIRASSDVGNTFANEVTLNSTPGGINK
jgi:hypothetical protein